MKKFILSFAASVFMLAACTSPATTGDKNSKLKAAADSTQIFNLDTTALAAGAVFYECPMDLEVISDKPGTCPKCDMELEKKIKQ